MVANKSHYLGSKKLNRHLVYEPLDISVNITLVWKNQMYRVSEIWVCSGDCSFEPWDYALTTKIIDQVTKVVDKYREELAGSTIGR